MDIVLWFLRLVLYTASTAIEVVDDRRSDPNKRMDVLTRAAYIGLFSFFDALITHILYDVPLWVQWSKGALVSFAIFFFAFDYIMAKVYNKPIDFLGTTSVWDRFVAKLHPRALFIIRSVVLLATILIYIIW